MRFGKEKPYDNHVDYLAQIMECMEGAIFNGRPDSVPIEATRFVKSQYERFGIIIPRELDFLYDVGPGVASFWINYVDPYAMYWDYSDVTFTGEWCDFAFELVDEDGFVEELDPEGVETFRYNPAQGDAFFNHHIMHPGLKAMPDQITASADEPFWDFLNGYACVYALMDSEYPTGKEMWTKVCRHAGVADFDFDEKSKAWPYFDLSLWAGILWWFGPLSREFRARNSVVQEMAITEGECLVYQGDVFSPRYYRKLPRKPETCYKCGVDAWCVQHTLDDYGTARLICEGCMSVGFPRYDGATCGTKFCKYFECKHNAWHNNTAGNMGAMRQSGQLAQEARREMENRNRQIAEAKNRKLIVGG